jgi:hypothetical protein
MRVNIILQADIKFLHKKHYLFNQVQVSLCCTDQLHKKHSLSRWSYNTHLSLANRYVWNKQVVHKLRKAYGGARMDYVNNFHREHVLGDLTSDWYSIKILMPFLIPHWCALWCVCVCVCVHVHAYVFVQCILYCFISSCNISFYRKTGRFVCFPAQYWIRLTQIKESM